MTQATRILATHTQAVGAQHIETGATGCARTASGTAFSTAWRRRLASGVAGSALALAGFAGGLGATAQAQTQTPPASDVKTIPLDTAAGVLDAGGLVEYTASFEGAGVSADLASIAGVVAGGGTPDGGTPGGGILGGAGLDLALVSRSEPNGDRVFMRLHQVVDGVRVYGADLKAVSRNGALEFVTGRTASVYGRRLAARVSADAAIDAAVAHHHAGAGATGDFWHEAPRAESVLIPRGLFLEEGFVVSTWSAESNTLHYTLIDSGGLVVESQLRTNDDSYRVFRDSPATGGQVVLQGPGEGSSQSPEGWVRGDVTQYNVLIQGNNAAAYLDTDNNNQPDGANARVIADANFLAVHDATTSPSTNANKDVAVQNLFYHTNLIHDRLYDAGFTEGVGNFQENNFGRGGAGSDSVYAEAQDGSGTNNANFTTPVDGSNPRMQMYVWTSTNPNRDGDLDSDIIYHEYGHGLTWRMIGNMSGAVSGAIGEGMSDTLAILVNDDDAMGEFSTNRARGVRSAVYTDYGRTIGDFTGSSVHFDGEIYGATMWRASELYKAAGLDNDVLLDTLVAGMNFTPSRPTYLDMRDGVLQAAPSSQDCLIWRAFADFGMGEGAVFTVGTGSVSIGESFDVPAFCGSTAPEPEPEPKPEPEPEVDARVKRLLPIAREQKNGRWRALVRIVLAGEDRAGQMVTGRWSNGVAAQCTTNGSGRCTPVLRNLDVGFIGFQVQTIAGQPAGGSPLTVTVNRP